MRILIADDKRDILIEYVGFFERRGHKVVTVTSAEQLLAELVLGSFDAIITDNSMGGPKTGLDALREIRAGGSQIPVAVVSGDYIEEEVKKAGGLFSAKPVRMRVLLQQIFEENSLRRPHR